MKKSGLTISIIFEAESANYGDGFGNIGTLKKISRGDGNTYSYISRQALRYNMINQLGWDSADCLIKDGSGEKSVIQFAPNATIDKYPEIDLFGYLKTSKGSFGVKRNAVVRLSNAIALEEFSGELDYLTNAGFSARLNKNVSSSKDGIANNIAQSEIQKSFYAYTITIDLDLIGIDGEIIIPDTEKAKRVKGFLGVVKALYRDIRGRRENLSPVFVIGGLYAQKNPFFENRLHLKGNKLDLKNLSSVLETFGEIREDTMVGYIDNTFSNSAEIVSSLNPVNVGEFFKKLSEKVEGYYG